MKHLLLFILLAKLYLPLSAQSFQDFDLQGIIGTKLYTDNYEGPNIDEAWQLKSALSLGFELTCRKWPRLSLAYLHDRFYTVYNRKRVYPPQYQSSNLFSTSRGNYWGIYYHHKNLKYGLGSYRNLHEDEINYTFISTTFLKSQIALSCALKAGRMEFELVKLFQYHQLFSVFDIDLQYLNIKYKLFGKKDSPILSRPKSNAKTSLAFKIGLRGFPVRNDYLLGEDKQRVGMSFQTGIEFKFKKINTALFAERDWWVRLNGGSHYREMNGYVVNSVLGVKYSVPQWKNAFVSVGYDWTTDYNTMYEIWDEVYSGNRKRVDLYYYNVKGLAVGLGIPVFKKFDLDFRSILALRGEKTGNPMRFSLGIAYKINP